VEQYGGTGRRLERRERRQPFAEPGFAGRERKAARGVKVGVVGHVEWVEFARVEAMPRPGGIVHAWETWAQAGGGGAVAALQLVRLGADASLYTALGDDELGRRAYGELAAAGIRVHASFRREPQRRAFCHVEAHGERTITVLGEKLRPRGDDDELPWDELAGADAVYFVSGDSGALRRARRASVLVATARELTTLRASGIALDALVGSGEDEGERYQPGDLDPAPALVVSTAGALGGWAQPGGPFTAAPPPAEIEDAYGCGDCFAAGLTYGLADGLEVPDALALAARCGAGALSGRGVHAAAVAP
jgi:ribokinase